MLRERLTRNLKAKITVAIVVPVMVIGGLFTLLQFVQQRQAMLSDVERSATQVGEVIESSLVRAMMTHDLESIQYAVDEIAATQEDITEIMLIDKPGEIKASFQGLRTGEVLGLEDPTCQLCHRQETENRNQSVLFTSESGERYLRNVNPIANDEQCLSCHSSESSVLGILITDLSMSRVNSALAANLRDNFLLSAGMLIAVVLSLNFMIGNTVVNKIEAMVETIRRFAKGDLSQRASVNSEDELGELAGAFNDMADGLNEKAKLEQEVYKRTEELQGQTRRLLTLNAVASTVNRSLDVDEMLRTGLKRVLDLLGLDAGEVWLLDGGQASLSLRAEYGQQPEFREEDGVLGMDECLCGHVAASGHALSSASTGSDPRLSKGVCCRGGYLSTVAVPLTSREKTLGVLALHHREQDHFHAGDLELLDAIGKQLGVAVQNAQLYAEMEQSVAERTRHLELLYQVTGAISGHLQNDPLLQDIVKQTARAVQAGSGIVMTNGGPGDSQSQATYGQPSEALARNVWALLNGGDEHLAGDFLTARISSHGRVVGALGLERKEGHASFGPEDSQLLQGVAAQAAVALENAALYSEMQDVAVLEERERLAREIHDGLAQTLGYLRLRLKTASEQVASGELVEARSILADIIQTTEEAYVDAREAIADLRSAVFDGADLVDTLDSYVEEYGLQNRIRTNLAVETETEICPPAAQGVQLIRIVQQALSNVRKHADATSVAVRLRREDHFLVLTIEDDGRGFDVHEVGRSEGRHFGLNIMRERAESLGGILEVYSGHGLGTRVIAKVPLDDWRE
jgi:nitrate/nitrite-specific signal transduction histidine kinase